MAFIHFGYIDPGSGSMLLQVIFGGVLGSVYVGRNFIRRVITSLKAGFSGQPKHSDQDRPQTEGKDQSQG